MYKTGQKRLVGFREITVKYMKLSIVITTRNRIVDLLKCIDSIVNSKLLEFEWELVVVDDSSTDETRKLNLDQYSIKYKKIIHNTNQEMMVKSRNIGIRSSSGKYILFIDDDNIIDKYMICNLVEFAERNKMAGIVGPSMFYLKQNKKYMDFQKINFYTGRTYGVIDSLDKEACKSDGVPNVFLIKREVFDTCGLFDESLIQTFTEPDFAFNAKKYGYDCYIIKKAKTYHNVNDTSTSIRTLGGKFKQKAYCLMRNRSVIVARYGSRYSKFIYLLFFSIIWPALYSLIMLPHKRFDLIYLYWRGFIDGVVYMVTGRLKNSLA